ncbi:MAG: exodeoxyribonuclease VII small subunit, partial [Candidatus Puniceispirillum sp.]
NLVWIYQKAGSMSDTDNTPPPAAPRSLDKISFEDALGELERIVASLERGEVSLDDAIKAFERGTELKSHCQARLEEARMRVEKIKLPPAGEAPDAATPFDPSVV